VSSRIVLLRQCVLAASVLGDLDIDPRDDGVVLPGTPPVMVAWTHLDEALGSLPPTSPAARHRLERWLRLRRAVADHGQLGASVLARAARLVALPPDHVEHPGPAWVMESLPGGALDLGVGVLGLGCDPDRAAALPPGIAWAAHAEVSVWWPQLRTHAERMGELTVARLRRDGGRDSVLRPVGGCDVLALLASTALRTQLARSDGSGMRALAVPSRGRGWFDLRRVDPAFVVAAWTATDPMERGAPRPLLVTTEEVALAIAGGDPARYAVG